MDKYLTKQELESIINDVDCIVYDYDDTLVDSLQADVTILNKRYNKNVHKSEVKLWNFRDVFPELGEDEIEDLFDSKEFFDIVQFKDGAKEFVLSHKNPLIVTKGRGLNIRLKKKWLINNGLKNVKFIGVPLEESKDLYIPYNSLFIDDNANNLNDVDCKYKVLFETNEYAEWQENWQGMRIKEW